MKIIEKLQKQPLIVRKRILWGILVAVGLVMAGLWLWLASGSFGELNNIDLKQGLNLDQIYEQ